MRAACHVLLRAEDQPATERPALAVKSAASTAPTSATSGASGATTVASRGGPEPSAVQSHLAAVPQPTPLAATLARLPGPRAVAAAASRSRVLGSMRVR